MEKLKTLKDIECLDSTHDHRTRGDFCIVRKSDLKQEAIKWVKNCKICKLTELADTICRGCERFVTFFNITEENLK